MRCSLLFGIVAWMDLLPRRAKTRDPPPFRPACALDSSAFQMRDGEYSCRSYAFYRFS